MSQFPHIPVGGSLPRSARTFNALMDAGRRVQSNPMAENAGPGVAQGSQSVVWVKNNSGADVGRFGVLGIDNPIIDQSTNAQEFYRRVTFDCSEPTGGTHEGRFVIALDAIKDGAIGRAAIDGVVQCQVSMTNDADGFAEIADGDPDKLTSAAVGSAKILWAESGTGTKWAVVQLGSEVPPVFAKITGSTSFGSTGAQWYYTITQVSLTVTASGGTPTAVGSSNVTGGISGGVALNIAEWANTTGVAFGIKRSGDYPGGFDPQPLGSGSADGSHAVDDIVKVVGQVTASDGTPIYIIERMGVHDGTCSS